MNRPSSHKLLHNFMRLDGCRMKGFLTTAPVSRTSGSLMAIRQLNVLKPCFLIPGNVVISESQERLLLLESPQPQNTYEVFQVVVVSYTYPWSRKTKLVDPVSHITRDGPPQAMGVVYAYFDNPSDQPFEKLMGTQYQFYTGQDVQVGDLVGGKMVKKVSPTLGVNFVVAE